MPQTPSFLLDGQSALHMRDAEYSRAVKEAFGVILSYEVV